MRRHALRAALPILLAAVVASPAAQAQTLRTVMVPADATVVIAPRGQPAPAAQPFGQPFGQQVIGLRPAAPPAIPFAPPVLPAASPLGLAAVPGLILPLAAAALLGAGLPGGGSGGSAPAATR